MKFRIRKRKPVHKTKFKLRAELDKQRLRDHQKQSVAYSSKLKWSYGISTVPQRLHDLLPQTIRSLENAGFVRPRLFVDGISGDAREYAAFRLPMTCRTKRIGSCKNWFLAMNELYAVAPDADRYLLCEDDIIACKNLKVFLDNTRYPTDSYCNLYTAALNEGHWIAPETRAYVKTFDDLWYPSDQRARGSLALLFDNRAASALIESRYMQDVINPGHVAHRRLKGVMVSPDLMIRNAMSQLGFREFVFKRSLVQHMGRKTAAGVGHKFSQSSTFVGEDCDAKLLL